MSSTTRIAIIGGGHNALAAAAYLARAGCEVTVLERLPHVGGAAISAQAFDGLDARLSRYSYLVSLLPQRIIDDLGLDVRLARRRHSSYTPLPGTDRGLLVDNADSAATLASFESVGAGRDAAAWSDFYDGLGRAAKALFPTFTEPLPTRAEAARLVEPAVWETLVERPIGETIENVFESDLVRGVALTDALIGTFAPVRDASLAANRCFLYHVVGGGTGDWDVPIGGMGAVTGELERAARRAGARILTNASVTSVSPDGEVRYVHADEEHALGVDRILSGVAPHVLASLLETAGASAAAPPRPEGAQVKVNLFLRRLPRLRECGVDPAAAFGGTFHINELYSQLDAAHEAALDGRLGDPLPAEIYCHSLTDPSILSPELQAAGAHTLTVFGLQVPDRLLTPETNDAWRARLERAVLDSLDSVLAEPVDDVLMTDAAGRPCVETKTTLDLEADLAMPGGNIFHGPLSWPFADDDAELSSPAARWGVATEHERILLCGSGAQRGGGVSAIGGHNAAHAILEEL